MSDPAPRRRLRFSLRSLIIFIVLISSGTGLWYQWEPWILERTLSVDDARLFTPTFATNGQRVLATYQELRAPSGNDLARIKSNVSSVRGKHFIIIYDKDSKPWKVVSGALIWDVSTGRQIAKIETDVPYCYSFVSSEGGRVVVIAGIRCCELWDVAAGKKLWESDQENFHCFSVDGRSFVTSNYGAIRIRRSLDGSEMRSFDAHKSYISDATISADGSILFTAGNGREYQRSIVRSWDPNTGRNIANHSWRALNTRIRFSSDGALLLITSSTVRDNRAEVLVAATLEAHVSTDEQITRTSISADGSTRWWCRSRTPSGDPEWVEWPSGTWTTSIPSNFPPIDLGDGNRLLTSAGHSWVIAGTDQSQVLARLGLRQQSMQGRFVIPFDIPGNLELSPESNRSQYGSRARRIVHSNRVLKASNGGPWIEMWHRRRPEYWWGVAWLPEFWLTVVLGVGLVFSLWRDSRIMRA